MSVIDEIKARIDIVDVISEDVQLRKSGTSMTGFCPFHDNRNTPSFVVWPESGTWRCFGACAEGGDVFKYVMKRDNLEFGEALKVLAKRAGIEIQPRSKDQIKRDERHKHLHDLLDKAVAYYQHLLLNAPQAQIAHQQLRDRGVSPESIQTFGLGYSLDDWHSDHNYFKQRGWSDEDLVDAGLLVRNDEGRVFDRFRNRIMIPIRDEAGRTVGFGARVVDKNDSPKYMNSPQSDLFNKSQLLYGMDQAKRAIRELGTTVVVEGYMDVIAAHQAGFHNVVAPMGTALTEPQLTRIKRLARRLVLALDADEAGLKATVRGLETARRTLDEAIPSFSPQGMVRYESRLGLDIRVAVLPDGMDPDDVIHQSEDAWPKLVDNAQPIVEFMMGVLAADHDLSDPKAIGDVAREVMALLHEVNDPAERAVYEMKLARLLGIDERALVNYATPTRSHRPPPPRPRPASASPLPAASPAQEATPAAPAYTKRELYVAGALARQPDALPLLDRFMRGYNLAPLDADDFGDTGLQAIFHTVQGALRQAISAPADYVLITVDPSLEDLLNQALAAATTTSDDHRQLPALQHTVLKLREDAVSRWDRQLRLRQAQALDAGDLEQVNLILLELNVNTKVRNELRRALSDHSLLSP